MRQASRSAKAKIDIKTRQHLMERSYARGTWYGFDRARWRRLWRVQIQEYLIATIQNIEVLLRYGETPTKACWSRLEQKREVINGFTLSIFGLIKNPLTLAKRNHVLGLSPVSVL